MSEPERERPFGVLTILRWLSQYPVREWHGLVALSVATMGGIALSVLQPWPMKILVDNVLQNRPLPATISRLFAMLPGDGSKTALLTWSVAGTIILFLLNWLVGLITAYLSTGFGQRMIYDLAADLFSHLQRLSLRFHHRKQLGDTIRRVTSDCSCVSTIVLGAALPLLTSICTLAAMFAVMWRLNSSLTLLSVAVVPLMLIVFKRYAEPLLERGYEQQEIEGKLYSLVEQTLSSIPVVQAYTREVENERAFAVAANNNIGAMIRTTSVQMQFKILIGLTTTLGTAGILWIGGWEVLAGHLSVGSILIFLSYLASLYAPLNQLMYTSSTIQGAAGSARRVIEILQTEHDVSDKPGAPALVEVRGHVLMENISFGYAPEQPIIKDVSLEARPGDVIAIVGPTGAGKTTVVGMVPRLFDPWTGRVVIDGKDVRDVQLKSLRRNVAVVLQDPFLFPLTMAENIAYGRPEASLKEIQDAARAANAHPFIERLPNGYDTIIGERGATLSGGERQRVSIARALLKNAPILILDEPTSALDVETESLLLQALDRLMQNRTTFIIAHRLSTIRNATKIVVLKQGRVDETGTHDELLRNQGLYAELHRIQFGPGGVMEE